MFLVSENDDRDSELIAAALQCVELDKRHEEATNADTTDGEDPALHDLDRQVCNLSLKIRQTRAKTLDGIFAKARVLERFLDLWEMAQIDQAEYPVDPETMGASICRDLIALSAENTSDSRPHAP